MQKEIEQRAENGSSDRMAQDVRIDEDAQGIHAIHSVPSTTIGQSSSGSSNKQTQNIRIQDVRIYEDAQGIHAIHSGSSAGTVKLLTQQKKAITIPPNSEKTAIADTIKKADCRVVAITLLTDKVSGNIEQLISLSGDWVLVGDINKTVDRNDTRFNQDVTLNNEEPLTSHQYIKTPHDTKHGDWVQQISMIANGATAEANVIQKVVLHTVNQNDS